MLKTERWKDMGWQVTVCCTSHHHERLVSALHAVTEVLNVSCVITPWAAILSFEKASADDATSKKWDREQISRAAMHVRAPDYL